MRRAGGVGLRHRCQKRFLNSLYTEKTLELYFVSLNGFGLLFLVSLCKVLKKTRTMSHNNQKEVYFNNTSIHINPSKTL